MFAPPSRLDALRELTADKQAAGLAAIAHEEVRREVASLLENAGNAGTLMAVVGSSVMFLKSLYLLAGRWSSQTMVAQASACGFSAAGLVQALRKQDTSEAPPQTNEHVTKDASEIQL